MKILNRIKCTRDALKHFALTAVVGSGLVAGSAQAQAILDVGGAGAIGDTTLTAVANVAKLPASGVNWTTAGGEGTVTSNLISPELTVTADGAVTLTFTHRYFLEEKWDGGAVLYSVNGVPMGFVDLSAAGGIDTTTFDPGSTAPPFLGAYAFTGQSVGWGDTPTPTLIQTVLSVPDLKANDKIVFTFRGAWDAGYMEAAPNWEIGTVKVVDNAAAQLLDVDFINGSAGFTVVSDAGLAGPWKYLRPVSRFEINGDTLAADRYVPDTPGAVIDLNGADLSVALLAGTLEVGDSFTLFDLAGGTTLQGTYSSITLPPGTLWDLSNLGVSGKIVFKAVIGMTVTTYDNVKGPSFLNPIANLMAVTPSGTALQTSNIDYHGNFGTYPALPGLTGNDNNSLLFDGWFDVSKGGPGVYTFGTSSDDGTVLYMDLNNDGDFADAGELIVDNNRDQGDTSATGSVTLNMPSVRVAIGFYQGGGGADVRARFGKGSELAWNALVNPIPGPDGYFYPSKPGSNAEFVSFGLPGNPASINPAASTIDLIVPEGTSVTNLAPTFTLANGATCNRDSGTTPYDFTSPVTYIVTNPAAVPTQKTYTVTVTYALDRGLIGHWGCDEFLADTSGYAPYGTHDGIAQGTVGFSTDLPAGFTGNSLDLSAPGNNGVMIANTSTVDAGYRGTFDNPILTRFSVSFWAKGFPASDWNPWVGKNGEGNGWQVRRLSNTANPTFTIRGTGNDDPDTGFNTSDSNWHHYVGVFDGGTGTRRLYVDGVDKLALTGLFGAVNIPKGSHLMLGGRDSNGTLGNWFNGKLFDVRMYNIPLDASQVQTVMTTQLAAPAPQSRIASFGLPGNPAVIDQTAMTIALTVPNGTNVAYLKPTFTLSAGTTCDRGSGTTAYDFTTPVTYTVTNPAAVPTGNTYTVTVTVAPIPPAGVPDLVLWLDASAPGTMTLSGTTVTEWRDKMGGRTKATRRGGAPTLLASGIGSLPTVHFDNLSWMNDGVKHASPVTVLYVSRQTGGANFRVLGAENNWLMGYHGGFNQRFHFDGWVYGEPGITASDTAPHLYATTIQGAGANTTVYGEGTQLASNTGGTNGPDNLQLNGYANDRNELSNCDISEVLVYNRVLSPAELNWVGSSLAEKYGLTTTYPPTTPEAKILTFSLSGYPAIIDQDAKTITLTLPHGTPVTNLASVFTLSAGATCDHAYGSTEYDFTSPVDYVVTNPAATPTENTYTVTITPPSLPPVTTGMIVCLPADNVNTADLDQVRVAGGSTFVKQWNDLSGNAHHATQTTAGYQPQYIFSGLNGKPVLRFASPDDDNGPEMKLGDLSSLFPSAASAFIVATPNNDGRYNLFGNRNNDTRWVANSWNESQVGEFRDNRQTLNYSSWPQSGSHVYALESSSSNLRMVIDGNQIGTGGGAYHNGNGQDWTIGDRPGNGQQLNGDIAEVILYDRVLSPAEADQVGFYLAQKYGVANTGYGPQKKLTSFAIPGQLASLTSGTNITVTMAAGTNVTNLVPVIEVSPGATVSPASGVATDFTNPVTYTVTSSNGAPDSQAYHVTVVLNPPFVLPPVTNGLALYFDASQIVGLSDNASVNTWLDMSGNNSHATVPSGNATPTYVANAGTETGLPAIFFARNGGAGNSGALQFTRDSSIRTVFSVFKGNSFLLTDQSAYHFHRPTDDNPATPIWEGTNGWTSDRIRNGSTYLNGTLVNGVSTPMPTDLHNGFNLLAVVTTDVVQADSFNKDRGTTHAGDQYQAEVLVYNRVLSTQERKAVERYLMTKWFATSFAAQITSFGIPGAEGVISDLDDERKGTIDLTVPWTPWGTALQTLNPTFTLTSGTCNQTSGSPPVPSFLAQNPATYTVTDGATVNEYTVWVTVTSPSIECAMSNVYFPGLGYAYQIGDIETNLVLQVPSGTPVTALAPTYAMSTFASGSPASGTSLDFTTPQTYRITAEDTSVYQDYSVTVVPYTGYAESVRSSGPTAYWPLNEAVGRRAHDNTGGHHGTYSAGGVTYRVPGPMGTVAVNLNGAADIQVPYAADLNPAGAFTAECWAKTTTASGTHILVQSMVQGQNPANANDRSGWALREIGPDLQFLVGTTSGAPFYYYYTAVGAVSVGVWQHVAAVYNGTTVSMFVDGVSVPLTVTRQDGVAMTPEEIAAIRIVPNPSGPVIIGNRGYGGWNFVGDLSQVVLHNRALTQREIQTFTLGTTGYADWAIANAGGQMAQKDYDSDGMPNGVEYFMGAPAGYTANPLVVTQPNGDRTVTWPYVNGVASFEVQASDNLDIWNPADPANVTIDGPRVGGTVTYKLPTGSKGFCRLMVTP